MVSFIIYVVGENSWEPVAWRIKSAFLCISKKESVIWSLFCFYFSLPSPHHSCLPTPCAIPQPHELYWHLFPTQHVFFLLAGTASWLPLGKLCVSTLSPYGLGGADPTFSLPVWVLYPRPGWWKSRNGDGKVSLAVSIRTNLWFCRNYWETGAKLVGCVSGLPRGDVASMGKAHLDMKQTRKRRVLRDRWTQSLSSNIWALVSTWS